MRGHPELIGRTGRTWFRAPQELAGPSTDFVPDPARATHLLRTLLILANFRVNR